MSVSKTSEHIQMRIKMPNPIQESQASSKAPNEDSKDMHVLCTFKIKIESQNLEHGYIRDPWTYLNQDQDAKPQSGVSGVLQRSKSGLRGHRCSLHLQNTDREQKFWTWLYERQVTISKSRSKCQTPVRNLQHPSKTRIRTLRTWMFFAPSKNLEHGSTKD